MSHKHVTLGEIVQYIDGEASPRPSNIGFDGALRGMLTDREYMCLVDMAEQEGVSKIVFLRGLLHMAAEIEGLLTGEENTRPPHLGEIGDISDGYHTFNELYEHRNLLWINLVTFVSAVHRSFDSVEEGCAFKTWKNDQGESWEGWFILGLNTKHGQITYHLPAEYWEHVNVREVERNEDYDGHDSNDVTTRLILLLN